MFDLIIVGMGCAGMSAGIYAKNSGLDTLILESTAPGGLLNKINIVDNYIGFDDATGPELSKIMADHTISNGVNYKIERVLNIKDKTDYKEVTTTKGVYKTKAIIIATGRKARTVNVEGEKELTGRGISNCALCDGKLFKNKDIIVLGGGNSAFEEAIYLANLVKSIKILVRSEITANEELQEACKEIPNIEIITNKYVTKFNGKDYLVSVDTNDGEIIKCDGAFVYYGYEADTAYLKDLGILNDRGYIEVDSHMRTKAAFIYACGDTIAKDVYQIATAVSEGAIAALSARKDIK